ncbi:glycoside hydrolase [Alloacidobacterium dinghuense]|uniref:chitinase n=1 Tax=Alloacidobacterium dinghuense TaxID=2763107 RepID=A0A7G8BHL7_9BACT|nr:glycosyl hydrolase family 18 protein [Alloacidobacterium dinghuense]QNI32037.1 glycoside hydrolase [Alloacidobacterium dinghuense]
MPTKLMRPIFALLSFILPLQTAIAQGTVPTFKLTVKQTSYTIFGSDPAQGTTTTVPTVLVPIALSFESKKVDGKPLVMDASGEVAAVLASPVFTNFAFASGGTTQYADAMQRTTFPNANEWHTLLGKPEVKPVTITVPAGYSYVLTSKKTGQFFAVADVEFVQRELFKQIPKQDGKLVIAVTRNTTYYVEGDATECCSWGTHGVDTATGNSFVLGSYLHDAPAVVEDTDVQPLTQQLAEFIKDPLHNPLVHFDTRPYPGNAFPAWLRLPSVPAGDQGRCGGITAATAYFLLEPTNNNEKNNIPSSKPFAARTGSATYHLQNAATLSWYLGATENLGTKYSFPDAQALPTAAMPCPARGRRTAPPMPTVAAFPQTGQPNGHQLIGYWEGYGGPGSIFPAREISPQWDVVIVAFATPDHSAPEGTMQFHTPAGLTPDQFKADIAWLKNHGHKVVISLGGGGEHFTLVAPQSASAFVSTVTNIVSEYGFDGIDIDFESPSLSIDAGDADYRHPTTPSIVNLISALRQLHDHFGSKFMISLVPEGTQIPSGYPSYGGQFGSYLPIVYAIRDILSFVDVQDYNTPPLEGLDGEIYQPGSVDYHAAMTELLLHGFDVGGDPQYHFDPLPAEKVAVGFLTPDTTPAIVSKSMDYIIAGKAPAGTKYKLLQPSGYPAMIGAMFWTIDDDRRHNYNYSNTVGPQLHSYPAAK